MQFFILSFIVGSANLALMIDMRITMFSRNVACKSNQTNKFIRPKIFHFIRVLEWILINPSRMFICYLFNRQCTSSAKAWVLSVSLQSYSKIGKSQSFSCVTAIHRDSVICKRHSQIMAMIRMYNNLNLIANFQMKWKSDADILEQFAFWSECGTICTAHVFFATKWLRR